MTPEEFVFEYLRADQDTGAGSYEKMVSIIKDLDWEKVKPHILKLKYFYFLRTSFWLIISHEIKRRANWRCSCGCRENLQTHHLSNDHHGEEHLYMNELQVLCKKCHQSLHGPSVKVAEKRRQRSNKKEKILSQLPYYPNRIPEDALGGFSFTFTRKMLEELEHEGKIVIDRDLYGGWQVHRK